MASFQPIDSLRFALQLLRSLLLGPGPIRESKTRQVCSRPRGVAFARSVVLGSDLDRSPPEAPYDLEGVHVVYRIGTSVQRDVGGAGAHDVSSRALSYQNSRRWKEIAVPTFDLIAAGGDRVIAKVSGDDRLFIGVVDDPYVHFPEGRTGRLRLPQCLFKLDPELASIDANPFTLRLSVQRLQGDDEVHPATERFPVFRHLLGNDNARAFTQRSGLWEQMNMRFVPRAWHELDGRPLRATTDPPAGVETYPHVTYGPNGIGESLEKRSVCYEEVLDLGVGVTHLHEQHDNRFGGELDNLGIIPIDTLREFTGISLTFDEAYQLLNGPLQDYGGWIDGTCIYYMLVRLKTFAVADREARKNAFAVLWTDEQTGFTERWRLLDLADHTFVSPFKPIIGLVADPDERSDHYPDAPFDPRTFWSPLAQGCITPMSRMAVSRQIVVLSGCDPGEASPSPGSPDELYTIHFGWPTMDRTWRWRPFPAGGDGRTRWRCERVDGDGLRIREDSTIVLAGSATLAGSAKLDSSPEEGWWCQRYLPADGQEQPSVHDLAAAGGLRPDGKPSRGYDHPWRFVTTQVFEAADRRFSHFGAYESAAAARHQAYLVTVHRRSSDELTCEDIAMSDWIAGAEALKITHRRLNWSTLAERLRGNDPDLDPIEHRTRPSLYNRRLRFKLHECPAFNKPDATSFGTFLLTHYDVRDDKLKSFDGVGAYANRAPVLTKLERCKEGSGIDDTTWIEISLDAHLRNDVRLLHGTTVAQELDAVSPPQIERARVTTVVKAGALEVAVTFVFARGPAAVRHPSLRSYQGWATVNVSSVRLGALFELGGGPRDPLLLHEWTTREWSFDDTDDGDEIRTARTKVWNIPVDDPLAADIPALLSERGAAVYGTSLWFIGATGLIGVADNVEWGG